MVGGCASLQNVRILDGVVASSGMVESARKERAELYVIAAGLKHMRRLDPVP